MPDAFLSAPNSAIRHGIGGLTPKIVVDMQRAFMTGPDAIPDAVRVRQAIDRLILRAREAGTLVVQLQKRWSQRGRR